jgi:hypothetical protein
MKPSHNSLLENFILYKTQTKLIVSFKVLDKCEKMMSSKSELTKTIETQQSRITRLEQRLSGLF